MEGARYQRAINNNPASAYISLDRELQRPIQPRVARLQSTTPLTGVTVAPGVGPRPQAITRFQKINKSGPMENSSNNLSIGKLIQWNYIYWKTRPASKVFALLVLSYIWIMLSMTFEGFEYYASYYQ